MQFHFGQPAVDRNAPVRHASAQLTSRPGSAPTLDSHEPAASFFLTHIGVFSGMPVAATRPHIQQVQGQAPDLPPALQDAIRREGAGDSFFAKLMQGQGDSIHARNNRGKTALAVATEAGHTALATMLGARGARR